MDPRLTSLVRLAKRPTVFHFGKYKGKSVLTVYHRDALYIGWCLDQGVAGVADSLTGPQRRAATFAYHEHEEESYQEDMLHEMYSEIMWGKE